MKIQSIFNLMTEAAGALEAQGILYALAGGIAANQYRSTMRQTGDVDFAIFSEEPLGACCAEK